jgi:hypothetical protein
MPSVVDLQRQVLCGVPSCGIPISVSPSGVMKTPFVAQVAVQVLVLISSTVEVHVGSCSALKRRTRLPGKSGWGLRLLGFSFPNPKYCCLYQYSYSTYFSNLQICSYLFVS